MLKPTTYKLTLAGFIVFLCLLATAIVIGVVLRGFNADATPFATTVLGMIGVAIPALLALLKSEETHKTVVEQNNRIEHLESAAETVVEQGKQVLEQNGPQQPPPQPPPPTS